MQYTIHPATLDTVTELLMEVFSPVKEAVRIPNIDTDTN